MAESMHGEVTNVGRRINALMNALDVLSLEEGDREVIEGLIRSTFKGCFLTIGNLLSLALHCISAYSSFLVILYSCMF